MSNQSLWLRVGALVAAVVSTAAVGASEPATAEPSGEKAAAPNAPPRAYYAARTAWEMIGQVEPGLQDKQGKILISADAQHIAFTEAKDWKRRFHVDGQPGPWYDELGIVPSREKSRELGFGLFMKSGDQTTLLYLGRRESKWVVAWDGKESAALTATADMGTPLLTESLYFSGGHLYYITKDQSGRARLYVDGVAASLDLMPGNSKRMIATHGGSIVLARPTQPADLSGIDHPSSGPYVWHNGAFLSPQPADRDTCFNVDGDRVVTHPTRESVVYVAQVGGNSGHELLINEKGEVLCKADAIDQIRYADDDIVCRARTRSKQGADRWIAMIGKNEFFADGVLERIWVSRDLTSHALVVRRKSGVFIDYSNGDTDGPFQEVVRGGFDPTGKKRYHITQVRGPTGEQVRQLKVGDYTSMPLSLTAQVINPDETGDWNRDTGDSPLVGPFFDEEGSWSFWSYKFTPDMTRAGRPVWILGSQRGVKVISDQPFPLTGISHGDIFVANALPQSVRLSGDGNEAAMALALGPAGHHGMSFKVFTTHALNRSPETYSNIGPIVVNHDGSRWAYWAKLRHVPANEPKKPKAAEPTEGTSPLSTPVLDFSMLGELPRKPWQDSLWLLFVNDAWTGVLMKKQDEEHLPPLSPAWKADGTLDSRLVCVTKQADGALHFWRANIVATESEKPSVPTEKWTLTARPGLPVRLAVPGAIPYDIKPAPKP